jgi:hypothetical protein
VTHWFLQVEVNRKHALQPKVETTTLITPWASPTLPLRVDSNRPRCFLICSVNPRHSSLLQLGLGEFLQCAPPWMRSQGAPGNAPCSWTNTMKKWHTQLLYKRELLGQGAVAHTCDVSYTGGRDHKIAVWGQPGQKLVRLPPQSTSQMWWHLSVVPAMWEA